MRQRAPDEVLALTVSAGRLDSFTLAELATQPGLRAFLDEPLRKGWALYQESGGELSLLQKELERWRARHFSQLFLTDPLSIAVPLGYIGSKEVEIENLRVLARGLWLGLSSEQTRSELILTREESRASA